MRSDWCVVVVGDRKGAPELAAAFAAPNSIYLTPELQARLPYAMIEETPWNHFARKNIGYLYAIHHGAEVFYDTDDDNFLKDEIMDIPINDYSTRYAYNLLPENGDGIPVLNICTCFSNITGVDEPGFSWPRGFPLDLIGENRTTNCKLRETNDLAEIGVLQSLADHDPDVDAIFRLTRKLPFYFVRKRYAGFHPKGRFCSLQCAGDSLHEKCILGIDVAFYSCRQSN